MSISISSLMYEVEAKLNKESHILFYQNKTPSDINLCGHYVGLVMFFYTLCGNAVYIFTVSIYTFCRNTT